MTSTTTDQIVSAARSLGELISAHPASVRYRNALTTLQEDIEAQRLMTDYNRQIEALHEKELAQRPIEVADKRKLQDLKGLVASHPKLREMQVAQMDYVDLMRTVDEAIGTAGETPSTS